MTKRIALTLTILLTCLIGHSQPTIEWAKTIGDFGAQSAEDTKWTDDGKILSTGQFASTVIFGSTAGQQITSQGSTDMFLMLLNDEGGTEWVKSFGGAGEDLAQAAEFDDEGNFYLIGSFSDSIVLGEDTLYTRGGKDILVLKLDSVGEIIWHFQVGGLTDDIGKDLAIDSEGNVNFVFNYSNVVYYESEGVADSLVSNGVADAGIMQLAFDSSVNWRVTVGSAGYSDVIAAIAVDSLNRLYAYGHFRDTVDFNPGPGEFYSTAWGTDIYLLKLESDGEFIWMKKLGNVSEEFPTEIKIYGGDILMTGQYKGAFGVFFQGVETTVPAVGHYDSFVLKMDLDGTSGWVRGMGGAIFDQGLSVAKGAQGEVYCTGLFTETMDIDPGPDVQTVNGQTGRRTMFIQKLNSMGDFMWGSAFVANADGYMRSVSVRDGDIVVAGAFKGTADIAPFAPVFNIYSDLSTNNGFIAMYKECFDGVHELAATSCGDYEYHGITYTTSGQYMDTLLTIDGCENITALDLTINEAFESSVEESACDSVIVNGVTYLDSGVYLQEYQTQSGCDSLIEVTTDVPQSTLFTFEASACDMYEFEGSTYTQSGDYEIVLMNQAGCDSLIQFALTIDEVDVSVMDASPTLEAVQLGAEYQWLDCDAGYSMVQGETSQSFTATENNSYAVEVSVGACVDTSACFQVLGIGLEELIGSNLLLFPNPAQGFVNVTGLERGVEIQLLDMSGRLMLRQWPNEMDTQIDLSGIPKGSYLLTVIGADRSYNLRLVVIQE